MAVFFTCIHASTYITENKPMPCPSRFWLAVHEVGEMQVALLLSQRRELTTFICQGSLVGLSHKGQAPPQTYCFQDTRDRTFFSEITVCLIWGILSEDFSSQVIQVTRCPQSSLSGCLVKRSVSSYYWTAVIIPTVIKPVMYTKLWYFLPFFFPYCINNPMKEH